MTTDEERTAEEECCGGIVPDDCCGTCPDCLDDADAWRETYAEDA